MTKRPHLTLIVLSLVLWIFFLQPLARNYLFDRTLAHIKWAHNSFAYGWIFEYGGVLVSKESYQLMSLVCFAFAKNDHIFLLAMSQGIACAIVAAQKIYFQQPRPYFVDTDIPVDCHFIDYGAPSAHTLLGVVNYGAAWVILMRGIKATSLTKNLTFWLLLLPTLLYIPISRVYVGNHAYD
jgi:hypothetical protein